MKKMVKIGLMLVFCSVTSGYALKLNSSAFRHNQKIPVKYTCDGEDVSPALSWSRVPKGTKSFALLCDDPDAPRAKPWVHWVLFNIPAQERRLPEAVSQEVRFSNGMRQGKNDFKSNNIGYRGPCPPKGHGVHHYKFKLYALNAEKLDIPFNQEVTKEMLLKAMRGYILKKALLVGTYERKRT